MSTLFFDLVYLNRHPVTWQLDNIYTSCWDPDLPWKKKNNNLGFLVYIYIFFFNVWCCLFLTNISITSYELSHFKFRPYHGLCKIQYISNLSQPEADRPNPSHQIFQSGPCLDSKIVRIKENQGNLKMYNSKFRKKSTYINRLPNITIFWFPWAATAL